MAIQAAEVVEQTACLCVYHLHWIEPPAAAPSGLREGYSWEAQPCLSEQKRFMSGGELISFLVFIESLTSVYVW